MHYIKKMKGLPEVILTSGCVGAPLKMYINNHKKWRFLANNGIVYETLVMQSASNDRYY